MATISASGAQRWIIAPRKPWLITPGTMAPGRPSLRAPSWSVKRGVFQPTCSPKRRVASMLVSGVKLGSSAPNSTSAMVVTVVT